MRKLYRIVGKLIAHGSIAFLLAFLFAFLLTVGSRFHVSSGFHAKSVGNYSAIGMMQNFGALPDDREECAQLHEVTGILSDYGLIPEDCLLDRPTIVMKDRLNAWDALINSFALFTGLLSFLPLVLMFLAAAVFGLLTIDWELIIGGVLMSILLPLGMVFTSVMLWLFMFVQPITIEYFFLWLFVGGFALAAGLAPIIFYMTLVMEGKSSTGGVSPGGVPKEIGMITNSRAVSGVIWKGSNWVTEELAGRIDEEGNIYTGSNWITEEKIGRIDERGNIYRGRSWFVEEKVGRLDESGNLYKGPNWLVEKKMGRMDKKGDVYQGASWLTEKKIGRIDKKDKKSG